MTNVFGSGKSLQELQAQLEEARSADLPWRDGKAFAYIYDAGREVEAVQKAALCAYLSENGLDPTAYRSLLRFENEVLAMAMRHLRAPEGAAGTFTSGGTESILLAVKAARDAARAKRPELAAPEMIVPVTAHAAFHKAGHYLGVRVVTTPVDPVTLRADVAAMRDAVTDRTILLVGSASGYAHGVVDPIAELGQLALDKGLLLHIDGCIGGFLLPFFRDLGEAVPAFSLEVPGVTSISMDLHKYAYCAKGASVVLYRTEALRRHQFYATAAWTGYGVVNSTIQSTKSGGPLAAAWAVMNHLGDAGYARIARGLLHGKKQLEAAISAVPGLRLLGTPEMPLLAFASDELDVYAVADGLTARGYWVQPQLAMGAIPANVHVSITPSNLPHLEHFGAALTEVAAEVRAAGRVAADPGPFGALVDVLAQPGASAQLGEMLRFAGIGDDGALPKERAALNALLERLPRPVVAEILVAFASGIYHAHASDDA